MMQYNVATGDRSPDLVAKVNAFLDKGWELHGSVSVATSGTNLVYAQGVKRLKEGEKIPSGGSIPRMGSRDE